MVTQPLIHHIQSTAKLLLLTTTLFSVGCAIEATAPPVAAQSNDLFDDDGDGVINARDTCADTPHDAIVDNNGCPTLVERSESNDLHILFANDSTVIPVHFLPQIEKMAAFLASYPAAHIELKGYASPVGSHGYNLGLSQRRAEVVRRQLIDNGVAHNRIKTLGFGDSDPVAASSQEEINTLSRRVTARVRGERGNVLQEWTIFSLRAN